tara:strand:- start:1829 stop:2284 length:456 start_codon:yes stop_codon:yes gene_type:complete
MHRDIEYAFNEDEILDEMQEYIDSTYNAHYSQNQYQSTEIIEDMGHGMGFALGNVIKYCQRYGKKAGYNRDDLKKVIHYGIIALAMHDRQSADSEPIDNVFREFDNASKELLDININLDHVLKDIQADKQTDNVIQGTFDKPCPGQEPGQD